MMPPELAGAIVERIKAGDAYKDIAARFNVSTMAIAREAKRAGVFVPLPPMPVLGASTPHDELLERLAVARPPSEPPAAANDAAPADADTLMREAMAAMQRDLRDPNPRTRAEAARVLLIARRTGALPPDEATPEEREAKLVEALTAPDDVLVRALARTGWTRAAGAA